MSELGREDPQPLDYANPRNRPASKYGWILLFILLPAVLLLVASLLLPSLNSPHPTSPRVMSASNLRQIGQGILLYTLDHNGDYPDSFGTILLNEDVTSSVFVSPRRSETPANGPTTQAIAVQLIAGPHLSYVYLGRGLSTKTVTPNTIVAYELVGPDGTNVLFGDGHVEFFDAAVAAKIVAKTSNGQFPVTMPAQ
jgi:prepilin-type processing-associated H-X9-DG protein